MTSDGACREQQRLQPGLDVAQVEVGGSGVQERPAEQDQHDGLGLPAHSRTAPTRTAARMASAKVAGANRTANPRPNVAVCMANSFRSIIGPTTRNANRAVRENWVRDAATNASASEQIDSSTARIARASTDTTGWSAAACSQLGGHHRLEGGRGECADDEETARVHHVVAKRVPEGRALAEIIGRRAAWWA